MPQKIFLFSLNLNFLVEEVYGKFPVIKMLSYELYNMSFILVKDFDLLEIFDSVSSVKRILLSNDT